MTEMFRQLRGDQFVGLLIVTLIHLAALWGLWTHRPLPAVKDATILFADFMAPPAPSTIEPAPRRQPARPGREKHPQPTQLVTDVAITAPAEAVAPPALPGPVDTAPAEAKPIGPVVLGAELSASCPEHIAPGFPTLSRRMGETGITLLRVELDEQGRVATARVVTGSGFARLDEAALTAVKTWRCTPAQRDGQPVRAVALQPFKFVLQGY